VQAKFRTMAVADTMREKLAAAFTPVVLEVNDESARHAGHAGATRGDGSHGETHFHVRLVTAAFEGVSRVERQRRVHAALAAELHGPVHALSLSLMTPQEAAR
jgi:BolA protein